MDNGNKFATLLVGLDGFVVAAVDRHDDELWVLVETTATRAWCRTCGVRAQLKQRRSVMVRDVGSHRPVRLVWRKRVWRCGEPACPTGSWRERSEAIGARRALTERARAQACERVTAGVSVAAVARDLGVGWHTVMAAVRDHGQPKVDDPARLDGVEALGLDETSFRRRTRHARAAMVTGFVDLDTGRLLELIEDRTSKAVSEWLGRQPRAWRERVTVAAIDPYEGYATALRRALPHATVVADPFHIVRLANHTVDQVRRRTQQETLGHRGRKGDPLYGVRHLLLLARQRLDDHAQQRIDTALAAGDRYDEVACAWVGKELVRDLYSADGVTAAAAVLDELHDWAVRVDIPELHRLDTTLRRWRTRILAFHDTGVTNGRTEAANLNIKTIKRVGRGFRNFHNYRLRVLLHCGVDRDTRPTARIRGRTPSLAA